MNEFFFMVEDLIIQSTNIGDVINQDDVVLTTLNAFPESYQMFVQGIATQDDFPHFDKLVEKLFNELHYKEFKNSKHLDNETLLLKF